MYWENEIVFMINFSMMANGKMIDKMAMVLWFGKNKNAKVNIWEIDMRECGKMVKNKVFFY